jgi:hypothetical protein
MSIEKSLSEDQVKAETIKHISEVRHLLLKVMHEVLQRGLDHDMSKFSEDEFPLFVEYTPKLKGCTYGSDEYKQYLKELKPALDHHYAENRHHPEHFENGVRGMNLCDVIEMFCDWLAATKRHDDGDIDKSIEINSKRFDFGDDLKEIFTNTARMLEEEK